MKEDAKPIVGFEGKYSIDSYGNVYNVQRNTTLGGSLDKDGYVRISLCVNRKKSFTKRRARLVAEIWIPNPDGLPVINHIDGNKTNDSVYNLEWCTVQHNTRHAWDTGLCKPYDRKLPYNKQGIIESNKKRTGVRYTKKKQSAEFNKEEYLLRNY